MEFTCGKKHADFDFDHKAALNECLKFDVNMTVHVIMIVDKYK